MTARCTGQGATAAGRPRGVVFRGVRAGQDALLPERRTGPPLGVTAGDRPAWRRGPEQRRARCGRGATRASRAVAPGRRRPWWGGGAESPVFGASRTPNRRSF